MEKRALRLLAAASFAAGLVPTAAYAEDTPAALTSASLAKSEAILGTRSALAELMAQQSGIALPQITATTASLIQPVADRPGHDRRYALDTGKLQRLGWRPQMPFDAGLSATVEWYRRNESWWRSIKDQDQAFRAYYDAQYGGRRSPG